MTKQIVIQQAREYFELGILAHAFILPVPMSGKWYISIEGVKGSAWHLATSRGEVREFANVDTALNALREIGWKVSGLQVHHKD